jgi:hypothetical protein
MLPPDVPPDLSDNVIVSVYKPEKGWTTMAYEVPPAK